LLSEGLIDEALLRAALVEQRRVGGKIGQHLVEMGACHEQTMASALSRQLGLELVDLDQVKLPENVASLLKPEHAERYAVFPIATDRAHKVMRVATADPTNAEALEELGSIIGLRIVPVVSTSSGVEKAIRRYYLGETVPAENGAAGDVGADAGFAVVVPRTPSPPPEQTPPPIPKFIPPPPPPDDAGELSLGALAEEVDSLHALVAKQIHLIRVLVESLADRGVIDREEFLRRVHGD
jgi:type IV pilus assembly protein PilB